MSETDEQQSEHCGSGSELSGLVMLRNFDEALEFMQREWGYETTVRPNASLTPVPYKKSVLHDYLESEEMTLLIGDDGNYYTAQDKWAKYGDYAETEYTEYGRFTCPRKVRSELAT